MDKRMIVFLSTGLIIFNTAILKSLGIFEDMFNNNFNFAPAALIIGAIILTTLIIKFIWDRDLNRVYRKMIYNHFLDIGFKKVTAERLSKANQSTIKKFLELTEIIEKKKD